MQASSQVQAICSMAMATDVGDGRNTLFWQDMWILGQRLEDVAPLIHSMLPKRASNRRTVHKALIDMVGFKTYMELLQQRHVHTERRTHPFPLEQIELRLYSDYASLWSCPCASSPGASSPSSGSSLGHMRDLIERDCWVACCFLDMHGGDDQARPPKSMVIYVMCPFPEPSAILQTQVECSVALGFSIPKLVLQIVTVETVLRL
ncbi:hypothetical protein PR202_gb17842 [Eleusine coracana subsp. coracana]|uniref:Uncharacterized protein n=1 Tax=Eleusine coracana subsp. coracana TaxID=191504 RepID=A0AAV5F3X7_ELECO|nr:hypothetical protein PR202_gb17842 [Eleusine coracana subsp. coracana]